MADGEGILTLGIMALGISRLIYQSIKFADQSGFIDIAYHYFYASMIRLGLDPFDPAAVEKVKSLDVTGVGFVTGAPPVYSPTYFVLFQPLTYIPFRALALLWLAFSVGCIVAALTVFLKHRDGDLTRLKLAFIILVVGYYSPLHEDLALGQNNTQVLLCAVALWYGVKKGHAFLPGVALALMSFIKIPFWFAIVFLCALGFFKISAIAAAGSLMLFLAGLPRLGLAYYRNYFSALRQHSSIVESDISNISFNGMLHRLAGDSGQYAAVVYVVLLLTFTGWVAARYYRHRKGVPVDVWLISAVTMVPLVSPHVEEHHLVAGLLAVTFLALNVEKLSLPASLFYVVAVVILTTHKAPWLRLGSSGRVALTPFLSTKVLALLVLQLILLSSFRSPSGSSRPARNYNHD